MRSISSDAPNPVCRRRHPRALTIEEQQVILDLLLSDRFINKSPAAIHATLLDEGKCLCSVSTMYRLLKKNADVRERRRTSRNITKPKKPELKATAPNEVWTWDITKLPHDNKWSYYYLYVIVDIFSRMIVGWTISERETAKEAEALILKSCWEQSIEPDQLVIHSDNGSPMKSKTLGQLFIDLGVAKSFSRPYVSNDNPFSEAKFNTLKSRPEYPDAFSTLAEAEAHARAFVTWHNEENQPAAIAYMTPGTVHYGKAEQCLDARQNVLNKAYEKNAERFVKGAPKVPRLPAFVGINLPITAKEDATTGSMIASAMGDLSDSTMMVFA